MLLPCIPIRTPSEMVSLSTDAVCNHWLTQQPGAQSVGVGCVSHRNVKTKSHINTLPVDVLFSLKIILSDQITWLISKENSWKIQKNEFLPLIACFVIVHYNPKKPDDRMNIQHYYLYSLTLVRSCKPLFCTISRFFFVGNGDHNEKTPPDAASIFLLPPHSNTNWHFFHHSTRNFTQLSMGTFSVHNRKSINSYIEPTHSHTSCSFCFLLLLVDDNDTWC